MLEHLELAIVVGAVQLQLDLLEQPLGQGAHDLLQLLGHLGGLAFARGQQEGTRHDQQRDGHVTVQRELQPLLELLTHRVRTQVQGAHATRLTGLLQLLEVQLLDTLLGDETVILLQVLYHALQTIAQKSGGAERFLVEQTTESHQLLSAQLIQCDLVLEVLGHAHNLVCRENLTSSHLGHHGGECLLGRARVFIGRSQLGGGLL
mmetsp:Transcript_18237/g.46323  ORF Transcript_18237/g.46323 Transcript_18237/m.46323 type:complete len:205 (+) Transcript_18237:1472-2086(+)